MVAFERSIYYLICLRHEPYVVTVRTRPQEDDASDVVRSLLTRSTHQNTIGTKKRPKNYNDHYEGRTRDL